MNSPKVLKDSLTIWKSVSTGNWHQFSVVCFTFIERHFFEQVINEKKHGKKSAGKMNPVIFGEWEVEAGHFREASLQEDLPGLGGWEVPMLQEIIIDLFGYFLHSRMADGRPL